MPSMIDSLKIKLYKLLYVEENLYILDIWEKQETVMRGKSNT